jgi:chemotaxis family two-component system sensor kinase Cph1
LQVLGIAADDLLHKGLASFLTPDQVDRIQFALSSSDPLEHNPVNLQLLSKDENIPLDGVVHHHDGFALLELEPSTMAGNTYFLGFYKAVSKTVSRLQSASTLQDLVEEAAAGARQISGFDRVLIYRIADTGDGQVIAESKRDGIDSYLGL